MNNTSKIKKGAAWLLALLFALALWVAPAAALAEGVRRPEADIAAEEKDLDGDGALGVRSVADSHDPPPVDYDFSTIRVLITTGNMTELWLDLYGQYHVSGSGTVYTGTASNPYLISIKRISSTTVQITNRTTDQVLATGSAVGITRLDQYYEAGYAKLTKSGSSKTLNRMYLGDIVFRVNSSGYLDMVNTVSMAYYLYGVVGYEMAPGCEDEALKAQAIVAKSFALYYVDIRSTSTWDVQDGFKSATYQGYRGFRENRLATMPHCLAVIGMAITYEGGFVPTCYGHSDGGETALPSHVFGSSRFDDAYSVSIDDIEFDNDFDTKRMITVTFGGTGDNSRFRDFILAKINQKFGVNAKSVVSILDLYTFDPVPGTERNMQKLHVRARVNTAAYGEHTYTFDCDTADLKSYPISDVDGSGDSYSSSKYVFSENYLIFWGKTTRDGYELYFARYGHGLGLSQIGANTRANETYNQSCEEILAFYFPKFELIQITESGPSGETGGPVVTPPTVLAYGVCTADDTNFREGPGTSYAVLGQACEGEHIDILDVHEDGWYKAILRGMTGYISMTYSRLTSFPSPVNGVFMLRDGVVLSRANLRWEPYINSRNIIVKLQAGTHLTSWAQINKWHYVTTENGYQGFISNVVSSYSDPYQYTGTTSVVLKAFDYIAPALPVSPAPGTGRIKESHG